MSTAMDEGSFWVTAEHPDPKVNRRLAAWKRSAAYVNGEVYVPAAVFGNEDLVILCAMHDSVATIYSRHHGYVPASWAKAEFPADSDLIETVECNVRKHILPGQASSVI